MSFQQENWFDQLCSWLGPKWRGPVLVALGLILLGYQSYLWATLGVIDTLPSGGGVGLVFVGVIAWYYYIDDKRGAAYLDGLRPTRDEQVDTGDNGDQENAAMDSE